MLHMSRGVFIFISVLVATRGVSAMDVSHVPKKYGMLFASSPHLWRNASIVSAILGDIRSGVAPHRPQWLRRESYSGSQDATLQMPISSLGIAQNQGKADHAAMSLSTHTYTSLSERASAVTATGKWILGEVGRSCKRTCIDNGLACSVDELREHQSEVNTVDKMSAIIKEVANLECSRGIEVAGGDESAVPAYSNMGCVLGSRDRALDSFSCDQQADTPEGQDPRRLCWCCDGCTSSPTAAPAEGGEKKSDEADEANDAPADELVPANDANKSGGDGGNKSAPEPEPSNESESEETGDKESESSEDGGEKSREESKDKKKEDTESESEEKGSNNNLVAVVVLVVVVLALGGGGYARSRSARTVEEPSAAEEEEENGEEELEEEEQEG